MAFRRPAPGETIPSNDTLQIIKAWEGDSGAGNRLILTAVNDSSNYVVDVQNQDSTNSYGIRVRDNAGTAVFTAGKAGSAFGAAVALNAATTFANNIALNWKDSAGTSRQVAIVDTSNNAIFGGQLSSGNNNTVQVRTGGSSGQIQFASYDGNTSLLTMSNAGEMLKPLQPAFLAYKTTSPGDDQTNVVGATSTVVDVTFAQEIFDQGGDYASPSFTAPVTGRYFFAGGVDVSGLSTAMHACVVKLVTSNRSYQWVNKVEDPNTISERWVPFSTFADMDASDTAKITLEVQGGAGNTGDILAQGNPQTFFGGCLIA